MPTQGAAGNASLSSATALTPQRLVPEYLFCSAGLIGSSALVIQEELEGRFDDAHSWKAAALLRLLARGLLLAHQGLSGEAGRAIATSKVLHSRIRHLPASLFGQAALFRGFLWAYLNSFTSLQADELFRVLSGAQTPDADDPLQALLAASDTRLEGNIPVSLAGIAEGELLKAIAPEGEGLPVRVVGMNHAYWYDSTIRPLLERMDANGTRDVMCEAPREESPEAARDASREAQAQLESLRLSVRRERDNPHDGQAMCVSDAATGRRVGYLRSRLAAVLSRVVDLDEELIGRIIAVPSRADAPPELHLRLTTDDR